MFFNSFFHFFSENSLACRKVLPLIFEDIRNKFRKNTDWLGTVQQSFKKSNGVDSILLIGRVSHKSVVSVAIVKQLTLNESQGLCEHYIYLIFLNREDLVEIVERALFTIVIEKAVERPGRLEKR